MTNSLFIVTGASRGLGAAIAEQVLAPNTALLCISRHDDPALADKAQAVGASLSQWQRDLADAQPVASDLTQWLAAFEPTTFAHACLINNAGVIGRVGPVDAGDDAEWVKVLRVGLEAPLLLSAAFLRGTAAWPGQRRILNISSGLGRRGMAGSASYCAAKAGLDNLSRAMALDEAARPHGARIVSLAPGVIDTDMQTQLRSAEAAGFPDQSNFIALKEQGQLPSADDTARHIIAFLRRPDFGDEVLCDIRRQ